MFLENQLIETVLEFAKNKMIISLGLISYFLIIEDWLPLRRIHDVDKLSNFEKHYIQPLPEFDDELFPFLVSSGASTFTLINTKTFKMNTFVN